MTIESEIDVDTLLKRVRAEVVWRNSLSAGDDARADDHAQDIRPPDPIHLHLPVRARPYTPGEFDAEPDGHYSVDELLTYHDEAFIHASYQAVFQRAPDSGGLDTYLTLLRKGVAKIDILGWLRESPEGRNKGAKVAGLSFALAIRKVGRWPILGRIVRVAVALWDLPESETRQRVLESRAIEFTQRTQESAEESLRTLRIALQNLENGYNQLAIYAASKPGHNTIKELRTSLEDAKLSIEWVRVYAESKTSTETFLSAMTKLKLHTQTLEDNKLDCAAFDVTQNRLREVLDGINHEIRALSQSKADRTELNATRIRLTDALDGTNLGMQALLQRKADRADLDAAQTRLTEVLDGINQRLQAVAQIKADSSTLDEVRLVLAKAVEAKPDRHELTTLANHLLSIAEMRLTRNDLEIIERSIDSLRDAIAIVNRTKADSATLDDLESEIRASIESIGKTVREELHGAVSPLAALGSDLRRNVLDQERRLGFLLEEARKRLPAPISTAQIESMLTEESHILDAMYASFEDRFRGSRADIKQRQSFYIPYIQEAKAGSASRPVLDLGCGRGEWLELLRDAGLAAQGVDLNRVFLEHCRDMGLNVIEQDALLYLSSLKRDSLGAVTSFHLVEHLPHKTLISLFDEALRVLMPGGLVIFETPNPENLIVGACNFYFDPTHLKPLPAEPLRFMLEARGFVATKIIPLHPLGHFKDLETTAPMLAPLFAGSQDYALIGRKA
jgi:SAM-dependent methyltransferase